MGANNEVKIIKRRDVWMVDFGEEVVGSEQGGKRPAIVYSNNIGNKFAPIVKVIAVTSRSKKRMPTHVNLNLKEVSIALCEQTQTISKDRLLYKLDEVNEFDMKQIDLALMVSDGLYDYIPHDFQKHKQTVFA